MADDKKRYHVVFTDYNDKTFIADSVDYDDDDNTYIFALENEAGETIGMSGFVRAKHVLYVESVTENQ